MGIIPRLPIQTVILFVATFPHDWASTPNRPLYVGLLKFCLLGFSHVSQIYSATYTFTFGKQLGYCPQIAYRRSTLLLNTGIFDESIDLSPFPQALLVLLYMYYDKEKFYKVGLAQAWKETYQVGHAVLLWLATGAAQVKLGSAHGQIFNE